MAKHCKLTVKVSSLINFPFIIDVELYYKNNDNNTSNANNNNNNNSNGGGGGGGGGDGGGGGGGGGGGDGGDGGDGDGGDGGDDDKIITIAATSKAVQRGLAEKCGLIR